MFSLPLSLTRLYVYGVSVTKLEAGAFGVELDPQ
jgi:hypothetical protein